MQHVKLTFLLGVRMDGNSCCQGKYIRGGRKEAPLGRESKRKG